MIQNQPVGGSKSVQSKPSQNLNIGVSKSGILMNGENFVQGGNFSAGQPSGSDGGVNGNLKDEKTFQPRILKKGLVVNKNEGSIKVKAPKNTPCDVSVKNGSNVDVKPAQNINISMVPFSNKFEVLNSMDIDGNEAAKLRLLDEVKIFLELGGKPPDEV